MKIIKQPEKKTYERDENLTRTVMDILDKVREKGDKALIEYAAKFDKMDIKTCLLYTSPQVLVGEDDRQLCHDLPLLYRVIV